MDEVIVKELNGIIREVLIETKERESGKQIIWQSHIMHPMVLISHSSHVYHLSQWTFPDKIIPQQKSRTLATICTIVLWAGEEQEQLSHRRWGQISHEVFLIK